MKWSGAERRWAALGMCAETLVAALPPLAGVPTDTQGPPPQLRLVSCELYRILCRATLKLQRKIFFPWLLFYSFFFN